MDITSGRGYPWDVLLPVMCQRKLDQVYHDIPGTTRITDDLVIYGKDNHDMNFTEFMKATRNNRVVLNKDKIQFKKKSVSFFGHTWTDKGL